MVAQGGPPLALAPAGLRQEKRKGTHASLGGATAQGSPLPLALAGLGQRLGDAASLGPRSGMGHASLAVVPGKLYRLPKASHWHPTSLALPERRQGSD